MSPAKTAPLPSLIHIKPASKRSTALQSRTIYGSVLRVRSPRGWVGGCTYAPRLVYPKLTLPVGERSSLLSLIRERERERERRPQARDAVRSQKTVTPPTTGNITVAALTCLTLYISWTYPRYITLITKLALELLHPLESPVQRTVGRGRHDMREAHRNNTQDTRQSSTTPPLEPTSKPTVFCKIGGGTHN